MTQLKEAHAAAAPAAASEPVGAAGPATATPVPAVAPHRARRELVYFGLRNRKLVVGTTIVLLLLAVAIVGPFLTSYPPLEYVAGGPVEPSGQYLFGTTQFGQDVFSQFVNGLRATFLVGVLGGGLAALVAMSVGFVAGYRGGWVDEVLNMLTNVVLVIPSLALLIVVASYLKARGVVFEAVFVGLTSWPWAARAIRAQTFSLRTRDFVDLARLSGRSTTKIIVGEIAPNMGSYLFMTFILLFGGAILIAATLDFIGLGPTEGMSLGLMMNNAVHWNALQLGVWWWFVPPGAGITAVVGALYVMNVGLDEIFNPKLRDT